MTRREATPCDRREGCGYPMDHEGPCRSPSMPRPEKPRVVCLCGSTKFRDAFVSAMRERTLRGEIVLTVGLFGHQEPDFDWGAVKAALDELHLRKIDLADYVLVLNVGGYVGESTRNEIAYAEACGKRIEYLEDNAPSARGGGDDD